MFRLYIASVCHIHRLLMQCTLLNMHLASLLILFEEVHSSGSKLFLGQNLATSLSTLDNANTSSTTSPFVNDRGRSLDRGWGRSRSRCGSSRGGSRSGSRSSGSRSGSRSSRSGSRLFGSQLLLVSGGLGGSGLGSGLLFGSLLLGGLFCCLLLGSLSLSGLLISLGLGLLGLSRPGISLGLSSLFTPGLGLGLSISCSLK